MVIGPLWLLYLIGITANRGKLFDEIREIAHLFPTSDSCSAGKYEYAILKNDVANVFIVNVETSKFFVFSSNLNLGQENGFEFCF
jgi:hypothetical protein